MPAMSTYLANKLVDHVLQNTPYTPPAALYVALFTTKPDPDGTGGVEVTGGSYARQAVTFADGDTYGQAKNAADIVYPNMPACTIVATGVYDALTAGNMLISDSLPVARTVAAAETLTALAGNFVASFQ